MALSTLDGPRAVSASATWSRTSATASLATRTSSAVTTSNPINGTASAAVSFILIGTRTTNTLLDPGPRTRLSAVDGSIIAGRDDRHIRWCRQLWAGHGERSHEPARLRAGHATGRRRDVATS